MFYLLHSISCSWYSFRSMAHMALALNCGLTLKPMVVVVTFFSQEESLIREIEKPIWCSLLGGTWQAKIGTMKEACKLNMRHSID
jgi:hypothetical protein